MNAAGIDFGVRRIAIVQLGERTDYIEDVLPKKQYSVGEANDPLALEAIYDSVFTTISIWKPDLVVIEAPIQGISVNVKVGLRLAMVAGVLAVACRHAGSSTLSVGPTEWKKAVVGVGNANKDAISGWLTASYPGIASNCFSQDLVDAACMALYAQIVLGR